MLAEHPAPNKDDYNHGYRYRKEYYAPEKCAESYLLIQKKRASHREDESERNSHDAVICRIFKGNIENRIVENADVILQADENRRAKYLPFAKRDCEC